MLKGEFLEMKFHYGVSDFVSDCLMRSERKIDLKILSLPVLPSRFQELGNKDVTEQKAVVRAFVRF